jgi:hypothetical protein
VKIVSLNGKHAFSILPPVVTNFAIINFMI